MPRTARAWATTSFLALLALSSTLAAQTAADLSVTQVDAPDPVAAGSSLVYTITVSNKGPDAAGNVTLSDPLPAGTTFQSLAGPAGWSCTTPAVGAGGTVSCSNASLAVGSDVFTLTVGVEAGTTAGTVLGNTVTVASPTADPNPGDETAGADTTVAASTTTVSITKTDSPDPVLAGANLTYVITASNNGGSDLESATVDDTLPAGTAFVSLASPAGWSCVTPAVGGTGTVSCSATPFSAGSASFTLVIQVGSGLPGGTNLVNQALLTVSDGGRKITQTAGATTLVLAPAVLSGTKEVSGGTTHLPGSALTYVLVLSNTGSGTQGDNPGDELTDVLPAGLTLVSATATSGVASANVATRTVTWNGSLAAGGSVTITINATIDANVVPGTTLTNQAALAYDADGDGANEASGVTDDPQSAGAADPTSFVVQGPDALPVPALDGTGLALLALLLAVGGAVMLRRRRA